MSSENSGNGRPDPKFPDPKWISIGTLIMVQGSRMAITGRMADGAQLSPYRLGQGDVVPTLARLNDYGKC